AVAVMVTANSPVDGGFIQRRLRAPGAGGVEQGGPGRCPRAGEGLARGASGEGGSEVRPPLGRQHAAERVAPPPPTRAGWHVHGFLPSVAELSSSFSSVSSRRIRLSTRLRAV